MWDLYFTRDSACLNGSKSMESLPLLKSCKIRHHRQWWSCHNPILCATSESQITTESGSHCFLYCIWRHRWALVMPNSCSLRLIGCCIPGHVGVLPLSYVLYIIDSYSRPVYILDAHVSLAQYCFIKIFTGGKATSLFVISFSSFSINSLHSAVSICLFIW